MISVLVSVFSPIKWEIWVKWSPIFFSVPKPYAPNSLNTDISLSSQSLSVPVCWAFSSSWCLWVTWTQGAQRSGMQLPDFPRLHYAHIAIHSSWPFPLFWYATLATSVLSAADFTLGKSSPLQEDRLYLTEPFDRLENKRVLPDGLAEHFRTDSMLAFLQESQQRSCKRISSEKSDPHSIPILCACSEAYVLSLPQTIHFSRAS